MSPALRGSQSGVRAAAAMRVSPAPVASATNASAAAWYCSICSVVGVWTSPLLSKPKPMGSASKGSAGRSSVAEIADRVVVLGAVQAADGHAAGIGLVDGRGGVDGAPLGSTGGGVPTGTPPPAGGLSPPDGLPGAPPVADRPRLAPSISPMHPSTRQAAKAPATRPTGAASPARLPHGAAPWVPNGARTTTERGHPDTKHRRRSHCTPTTRRHSTNEGFSIPRSGMPRPYPARQPPPGDASGAPEKISRSASAIMMDGSDR